MDTDATAKSRITLYTTDPCRRCERAKNLLRQHDLAFEEVNLAKDPEGRRRLAERTGHTTFPQITIDDRALGGLQELVEAGESGLLDQLSGARPSE